MQSQEKHNPIFKVRILDNPVGLISIHTERVRSGKLKILICEIVLVQTLKSGTTTLDGNITFFQSQMSYSLI